MSDYISTGFTQALKNVKTVKEIRAKGLMIAIELDQDCSQLLQLALDNKLLINITGQSIRLLPPLILNKDQADTIIKTVCTLIKSL
jgi:acetylornithine aminotransferase